MHGDKDKKPKGFKLKIRKVIYTFATPLITVREAFAAAGIDESKNWDILLRTKGATEELTIDGKIDLSKPGVESLRVKEKIINNGEASSEVSAATALMDEDRTYLGKVSHQVDVVQDGQTQWLIIRGYELPAGYNHSEVDIAIEIPANYPADKLDMFYCSPTLTLAGGGELPQTQATKQICGVTYQRWSRHPNTWNPATDRLVDHVDLIEESLSREVGA